MPADRFSANFFPSPRSWIIHGRGTPRRRWRSCRQPYGEEPYERIHAYTLRNDRYARSSKLDRPYRFSWRGGSCCQVLLVSTCLASCISFFFFLVPLFATASSERREEVGLGVTQILLQTSLPPVQSIWQGRSRLVDLIRENTTWLCLAGDGIPDRYYFLSPW